MGSIDMFKYKWLIMVLEVRPDKPYNLDLFCFVGVCDILFFGSSVSPMVHRPHYLGICESLT